jgi:WD40 repeat protein
MSEKYALVIGIKKYNNDAFRDLPKAATDAEAIADFFSSQGYTVTRLPQEYVDGRYRIASNKELTSNELEEEITKFLTERSDRQDAVIYFAGHGFRNLKQFTSDQYDTYLATSDSEGRVIGIRFDGLSQKFNQANLSSLVVFLDCCHAGVIVDQRSNKIFIDSVNNIFYTNLSSRSRSCLIAACRNFENALEDGENGVFTKALLEGLNQRYQGRTAVNTLDLISFITESLKNSGQEASYAGINFIISLINYSSEPVEVDEIDQNISPYPGLKSFTREQEKIFFGRTEIVDTLWETLFERKFSVLIGASGSGKSSVINAGLIPWVEGNGWKTLDIVLRSGMPPLSSLIEAFKPLFEGATREMLLEDLVKQKDGLRKLANKLPDQNCSYLIVIDRFEGVFEASLEEQTKFIDLITELAQKPYSRIAVVIAIRSDFMSYCSNNNLSKLIQGKQTVCIAPLNGADLENAIIKPARNQHFDFEDGLLGEIITDIRQEPGFLPLLQFTLLRLWEKRNHETKKIEKKEYIAIGRITGSLNKQADESYNALDENAKRLLEEICLSLVHTGEEQIDTRKQRFVNHFLMGKSIHEHEVIKKIIKNFVQIRLFTTGSDNNREYIELAHESLIEKWEVLAGWCKKDREWRRIKEKISKNYFKWLEKHDDEFLLGKTFVDQINDYVKSPSNSGKYQSLDSGTKDFIEKSIDYNNVIQRESNLRLSRDAEEVQKLLRLDKPINGLSKALKLIDENLKSQKLAQELPGVLQDILSQSMEMSREQYRFDNGGEMVKCVAISPSSPDNLSRQLVVSGGRDNRLKLWSPQGGCQEFPVHHKGTIWAVVFTPDGKHIISGSEDKTLRLWDLEGNCVREFRGHTDCIRSVAVSPDGLKIASASKDRSIQIWNLDGTQDGEAFRGHTDFALSVAFSPNTNFAKNQGFIVSGSADCTIRIWNLDGSSSQVIESAHELWVRSVAVSPKGDFIISGGGDNMVRMWDTQGHPIGEPFKGHQDRILSVSIAPQGDFIVSASADCKIRLWDLKGHSIGEILHGHTDWIRSVRISSTGKFIASASRDKTVRLWDLEGNLMSRVFFPVDLKKTGRVLSVAFSPNGAKIASGGEGNMVHIWDVKKGMIERSLNGHKGWVRSIKFINDKCIVSGSADNTLRLWNLEKGYRKSTKLDDKRNAWLRSVAVSDDGKCIVSSSDDGTACLWSLSEQGVSSSQCFDKQDNPVLSVAISPSPKPDSKLVVTGSADNKIRLWTIPDNSSLETSSVNIFKGHEGRVLSVAFSPKPTDGRYILSGSEDNTLRLWDLDGNQIWVKQHNNKVRSVGFSPDGKYIASGSADHTIRLWDIDGKPIGNPLTGHRASVRSIKFSPDGRFIVSGSEDNTIRLWDVGTWEDWLKICCKRVRCHPDFTSSGLFAELEQFIKHWSSRSTATHQTDDQ